MNNLNLTLFQVRHAIEDCADVRARKLGFFQLGNVYAIRIEISQNFPKQHRFRLKRSDLSQNWSFRYNNNWKPHFCLKRGSSVQNRNRNTNGNSRYSAFFSLIKFLSRYAASIFRNSAATTTDHRSHRHTAFRGGCHAAGA